MSGTTYKRLDRGPVEERAKVVIDATHKLNWAIVMEDDIFWLVDPFGPSPSVCIPSDVMNYLTAQGIFAPQPEGRLQ